MSFRKQRRAIEQRTKQQLETLEYKKRHLNKVAGKDLFETVQEEKKYGPIVYSKGGLKIAPTISISIWFVRLAIRYVRMSLAEKPRLESVLLTFNLFYWRAVIAITNWSIRKKSKPKGAIGNFVFGFLWQKIDRKRTL